MADLNNPKPDSSTKRLPALIPSSLTKQVSVMAWIEDHFGYVLLVKQKSGKQLWSFPGGKVKADESLLQGLQRELWEEVGLTLDVATPIDIFDRPDKCNVTFLYRVILNPEHQPTVKPGEIEKFAFRRESPKDSTPSLQYFWDRAQKSFEPLSLL